MVRIIPDDVVGVGDDDFESSPEPGFVEPEFTRNFAVAAEDLSTPADFGSHARDRKVYKRLRKAGVRPTLPMVAGGQTMITPHAEYEDELDDLVAASREIKRMRDIGSTYDRIGLVRHSDWQTLRPDEKQYADLMFGYDADRTPMYVGYGQEVAEAARRRDYRENVRGFGRLGLSPDDLVDLMRPIEGGGRVRLVNGFPPGFDPTTDFVSESKGRRYFVMGRLPHDAAATQKHVRRIFRKDGLHAHGEFWLFGIEDPEAPAEPAGDKGRFYAGPRADIRSEGLTYRYGEIPAGARVRRSLNAAGHAVDVMTAPAMVPLGIAQATVPLVDLRARDQYIIYHSPAGHFYGGTRAPLSRHARTGLRVPPGSYLIRQIYAADTARSDARHEMVRDSILSVPRGPTDEKERVLGHLLGSSKRYLRRVPIELLRPEKVKLMRDLKGLIDGDSVDRALHPDDRVFLQHLRKQMLLTGDVDVQRVIKQALLRLHPDKNPTDKDRELFERVVRILKDYRARQAST